MEKIKMLSPTVLMDDMIIHVPDLGPENGMASQGIGLNRDGTSTQRVVALMRKLKQELARLPYLDAFDPFIDPLSHLLVA